MLHTARVALASLALAALIAPLRANAVVIYAEASGAVSQFKGNEAFFGPGTDNPSGYGYGINFGGYVSLTGPESPTEIQLGIGEKLSLGSNASASYSILTLYPELRIQLSRIFISGGASPFVYRGTSLSDLRPVSSALAYVAEAGFLIPVTPRFSFALGGSAEWVSVGGVSGPSPVIQVLGAMRVYWGVGSTSGGGGGGSSATSNEFRGWRYPFGYIR